MHTPRPSQVATTMAAIPLEIPLKRDAHDTHIESAVGSLLIAAALVIAALVAAVKYRQSQAWNKTGTGTGTNNSLLEKILGARPGPGHRKTRLATVTGCTRLGSRHTLYEVQWRGRRLLIGCTEQALLVLRDEATGVAGDAVEVTP